MRAGGKQKQVMSPKMTDDGLQLEKYAVPDFFFFPAHDAFGATYSITNGSEAARV